MLLQGALLSSPLVGCANAGPTTCQGRALFEDADVRVCLEMIDSESSFGSEHYRAVVHERRDERVLFSGDQGSDFAAQRLPGGSLVVANSWMIAAQTGDPRAWLTFNVNGDTRADPRLRDALRWMADNPRFFVDARIRAAVNLVELGDPEGQALITKLEATPDLSWQNREVLKKGRASSAWR
ncbi:Hypothetical protein A7982_08203 [Minicystis rosea]|nr:Hypothetical protein A7982_08203 [Minicystis rosea]